MSWWAQRLARLRGEYTGPPSNPDAPSGRVSLAEWERSRDLRLDIRHGMVSLGNSTDIEFAPHLTPEAPMTTDPPASERGYPPGYQPAVHGTGHRPPMGPASRPPMSFREDLIALVNRHSMETIADIPDTVLADFLIGCMHTLNSGVVTRDGLMGLRPRCAAGYGDLAGPGSAGGSGGH